MIEIDELRRAHCGVDAFKYSLHDVSRQDAGDRLAEWVGQALYPAAEAGGRATAKLRLLSFKVHAEETAGSRQRSTLAFT